MRIPTSFTETIILTINFLNHLGYTEWLESLKDYEIRSRIIRRIERLKQGNYGDCKSVGSGVKELRFFFGSGYRVCIGESANNLVILLCGGDKDSQDTDIERAKGYWQAYQEEQNEQETENP